MKDNLFRKKSIDRISSPEQLNDYIKVANPGVWLLLGAIVILLAGIIVWSFLTVLDTVVKGVAISKNGSVVCYVEEENASNLIEGMTFTINDSKYSVSEISTQPVAAESVLSDYAMHVGGFKQDDWVITVKTVGNGAEDGIYEADIVVESVSPKTFVIN